MGLTALFLATVVFRSVTFTGGNDLAKTFFRFKPVNFSGNNFNPYHRKLFQAEQDVPHKLQIAGNLRSMGIDHHCCAISKKVHARHVLIRCTCALLFYFQTESELWRRAYECVSHWLASTILLISIADLSWIQAIQFYNTQLSVWKISSLPPHCPDRLAAVASYKKVGSFFKMRTCFKSDCLTGLMSRVSM